MNKCDEVEKYSIKIDCPEHNGEHKAILYTAGHQFEGIWECNETNEGISDTHDHYEAINQGVAEMVVEEGEVDTMRNGEHDTYTVRYYICGGEQGCGVELDGNPDEDAEDARVDAEIDFLRGK